MISLHGGGGRSSVTPSALAGREVSRWSGTRHTFLARFLRANRRSFVDEVSSLGSFTGEDSFAVEGRGVLYILPWIYYPKYM